MEEDTKKISKKQLFPKGFFWGASTSGHQVEGGNYNQWTVWELEHAREQAKKAGGKYPMASKAFTLRQLSGWPELKKEIEDPANYVSDRGVEHYKLYKHDFDILQNLNFNSFRFGIEWSRIEPEEGKWNPKEIEHYRNYIHELKKRGIEPFLNVWHYTLPVWFAEMGGFEKRSNLKYWNRFIEKVAEELIDDVTYVITINEPNVYATFGYLIAEHPPQKKSIRAFSKVYWNLTKVHRNAYKILKNQKPSLQIGFASQLANIQAKRPHNALDQIATKWMRYFWDWWFLKRTRLEQDFIGFNYYFTDYYRVDHGVKPADPKVPLNDLGWYMEPEGLYPLLLRIWTRFKKPIIVTENGLTDRYDSYRRWWLEETIVAMERALSEGVDLRGYFHWSLLDNFEWAYGWWPKFGLVEVDRNTMKRKVRPSAKWLAKKIRDLS